MRTPVAPAGLTIRGLRARPADVPMKRPIQTSGGLVGTALFPNLEEALPRWRPRPMA